MLCTLGKDRGFTERQEVATVEDDREARRQEFLEDIRRVYGEEEEEGFWILDWRARKPRPYR